MEPSEQKLKASDVSLRLQFLFLRPTHVHQSRNTDRRLGDTDGTTHYRRRRNRLRTDKAHTTLAEIVDASAHCLGTLQPPIHWLNLMSSNFEQFRKPRILSAITLCGSFHGQHDCVNVNSSKLLEWIRPSSLSCHRVIKCIPLSFSSLPGPDHLSQYAGASGNSHLHHNDPQKCLDRVGADFHPRSNLFAG
jgi:hypothetical protein